MTSIIRTGRIRYRPLKRWRKPTLLVLQFEEKVTFDHFPPPGRPSEYLQWRDARVEDLTMEEA